jgi:hypothetical protein
MAGTPSWAAFVAVEECRPKARQATVLTLVPVVPAEWSGGTGGAGASAGGATVELPPIGWRGVRTVSGPLLVELGVTIELERLAVLVGEIIDMISALSQKHYGYWECFSVGFPQNVLPEIETRRESACR